MPKVIAEGKAGTVLIETPDANGSGFCIHESGIFVTNAHVVEGFTRAKVVLSPGEADQRTLTVRVSHSDAERDLALLLPDPPLKEQVPDMAQLAVLPIGDSDTLFETMPVAVFGFPLGTVMALDDKEEPAVTVTLGRITALRKLRGVLREIQMDAAINPGNSGGPVINEQGEVVGIVHAAVDGAQGLNFAIPMDNLRELLKLPEIRFDVPILEWKRRMEEKSFKVQIAPFTTFAAPATGPKLVYDIDFAVGTEGAWRNLEIIRINPPEPGMLAEFRVNGVLYEKILDPDIDLEYRVTLRQNGRTLAFREDILKIMGAPAPVGQPDIGIIPGGGRPSPGTGGAGPGGGRAGGFDPGGGGGQPGGFNPGVGGVGDGGIQSPYSEAPVLNPVNNHMYRLAFAAGGVTRTEARSRAEATSFRGLKGHLVSINNVQEQMFIVDNVLSQLKSPGDSAWIGGIQKPDWPEPGGGWIWSTGEEMKFSNWAPGEPSDFDHKEYVMEIRRDGVWNDCADSATHIVYIVEYEPAAGLPAISDPDDVFRGPNGHFYQLVDTARRTTWNSAKSSAEALTYQGLKGHLVTITSASEQDFITARIAPRMRSDGDAAWLGGFKENPQGPDGRWYWTTREPFGFTRWATNEPNNYGNAEFLITMNRAGNWGDVGLGSNTRYYVVEYETDAGLAAAVQPRETP